MKNGGYVVVPQEPTGEMIHAAACSEDGERCHGQMSDDYRVMIAARPKASVNGATE